MVAAMIKTSALSSIAAGAPSARDGVSLQLPSRASLLRRLRAGAVHQWQRPRRAQSVVLILAAWLVLTANWPLWLMLGHLDGYSGSTSWLAAIFGPLAFAGLNLLLSFSAWPRGMKAVWMLVMVLAAAGQYLSLIHI